jgi:hypothetical protein
MSEAILETKPEEIKPDKVTKKANKQEEKLVKYAVLYFGDMIGKATVINYLNGTVAGNPGFIKPDKQLVIYQVTAGDKAENAKVTKGLETLIQEYGSPNQIVEIPTKFKNQSDAYLHSFNNTEFMTKVIETMGDDVIFLAFTFDQSCFSGLAALFDVGALETATDEYNASRPDKHPIRLIYENMQKDLGQETIKYFQRINELYVMKKDQLAEDINDTIRIDPDVMAEGKAKEVAKHYFLVHNTSDNSILIKATLDEKKPTEKTFYVGQYKLM